MAKVKDFFIKLKNIALWTAWYFIAVYLVFRFLFDFDILQAVAWNTFSHTRLHGYSGFILVITMAAVIPIYLAACVIIYKTAKPIIPISCKLPKKKEPDAEKQTESVEKKEEPKIIVPEEIPAELSGAFANIKKTFTELPIAQRVVCTPTGGCDVIAHVAAPADAPNVAADENTCPLPLPDSFDVAATAAAPVFRDLNFTTTAPAPAPAGLSKIGDSNVYTHDDPDFFIADPEFWFATGKQIESPIKKLSGLANPVLYLKEKNIMDLDAKIAEWEKSGIRVVFHVDEV